jgi:hypothetical protein
LPIPLPRISIQLALAVAAMLAAGCGAPHSTFGERSTVEEAVGCFVAGDYDGAEALFREVLDQPASDEDLVTAHLYLGRIYLERQDYDRAADMFSAGKALGGDVRFDGYFEEAASHLRISPETIIQEEIISRGQLAALLKEMFEGALGTGNEDANETRPTAAHWSSGYTLFVERSRVMKRLPDGDFHPDGKVTRPAFFVIVSRLTGKLGLSADVLEDAFPGGLRAAVASVDDAGGDETSSFVSGREAVSVLETVARAAGR